MQTLPDDQRLVIEELLLTVQHHAALGHEPAHHLGHGVSAGVRCSGLELLPLAPVLDREAERGRCGDIRKASGPGRVGIAVDGVVVAEGSAKSVIGARSTTSGPRGPLPMYSLNSDPADAVTCRPLVDLAYRLTLTSGLAFKHKAPS